MLKVTPMDGGVEVMAYGSGIDLVSDLCQVIANIHHSLLTGPNGAMMAEGFKKIMQASLEDDSPVWDRGKTGQGLTATVIMEDLRRDQ